MLHAQVKVIAHTTVPVGQIDKAMLIDCYTGDALTWTDDIPIIVLDLKAKTKTRKAFYKYLGKSPSRIKSIWIKKKLSGEGDPPQGFKTEADVIAKVAETPGAIGFVGAGLDVSGANVKTLLTINP